MRSPEFGAQHKLSGEASTGLGCSSLAQNPRDRNRPDLVVGNASPLRARSDVQHNAVRQLAARFVKRRTDGECVAVRSVSKAILFAIFGKDGQITVERLRRA